MTLEIVALARVDMRAGTFMNSGTYESLPTGQAGPTDRYNGLVKSARWNTAGAMATGIDPATNPAQRRSNAFSYTYDHHYRLASATYGTYVAYRTNGPVGATYPGYGSQNAGFTPSATQAHLLGELTYDPNGNIKTMHRNGPTGNSMDRFIYRYAPGSNKLLSVKDQAGTTAWTTQDLEDQDPTSAYNPAVSSTWNYQYDAIGNSVENKSDDQVITYTASGLVKEVRTQAGLLLSSYAYDGQGKRIMKTNHDAAGVLISRTWYAYDASGGLAATYEQDAAGVSAVQTEVPIGGGSRIGVLYRQVSNTAIYELSDHLGNVRATFRRDATLEEWTDYDAWGTPLEGRRQVSTLAYRYAYQGQEREQVGAVSSTAFELRAWDTRIGRWTAPDPYGQYFSAYVGMGNNPVSMVDPDGGWAGGPNTWRGLVKFSTDAGNPTTWMRVGKALRKVNSAVGSVSRALGSSGLVLNPQAMSGTYGLKRAADMMETATGQASYKLSRAYDKYAPSFGQGFKANSQTWAGDLATVFTIGGFMTEGMKRGSVVSLRSTVGRYGAIVDDVKVSAKDVAYANKKDLLKVAKWSNKAGRVLGWGGFAATTVDVASDGIVTGGEGVRVLIGFASAVNPGVGLAVGTIDMITEGFTGKSATQWLGEGIDTMTNGIGFQFRVPW